MRIPVVPRDPEALAELVAHQFRTVEVADSLIKPHVSDGGDQKRLFRGVANMLHSYQANQALPPGFGGCVEVTVNNYISVNGESSMLGVAAGFIAARAARYEGLPTLTATGALPEKGPERPPPPGEDIEVLPVDNLLLKLDCIERQGTPEPGSPLALPARFALSDENHRDAIEAKLRGLERLGYRIVRAERLGDVMAAWVPRENWHDPQLEAAFTRRLASPPPPAENAIPAAQAVQEPATRTPSIHWRAVFAVAALAAAATAGLLAIPVPGPARPPPAPSPFHADAACLSGAPRASADEAEICRKVVACFQAAAHPLDPDRAAAVTLAGPGIDETFLRLPPRLATAREACQAATQAAPASWKSTWHLSRVLEADGRPAEAAALREKAASEGEPMARLRQAEDMLRGADAAVGREWLRLLSQRSPPPPQAVELYGWSLACGLGGPPDPGAARALTPRLRGLSGTYAVAANQLNNLALSLEALQPDSKPPAWCAKFKA